MAGMGFYRLTKDGWESTTPTSPVVPPAPVPVPKPPAPVPTPAPKPAPVPVPAPKPVVIAPPAPGTYKPSAATTGCPAGTKLTVHNGDYSSVAAGAVITGQDIHGMVIINAPNITFRNCVFRGKAGLTTNTGLIDARSTNCKGLLIEDCDFVASFPSVWVDGIIGHDYTVRRCHIRGVVDGLGIYNTYGPNVNVVAEANWVEQLTYMSPDKNHSDDHTHNDGVQHQGGNNCTLRGNLIECVAASTSNTRSPYYPACTGQAIGGTPNVNPITNWIMDRNYLDGGAQCITLIPLVDAKGAITHNIDGATTEITGNKFGRRGHFPDPIRVDPRIKVKNFPTVTGLDTKCGNVWEDTGKPVTINIS